MGLLDKYELTRVVSVSNDMLKSEYYTQPELELTLQQKKLLMYLISKIEKDDFVFRSETIQLSDYCELFNIECSGGTNKKKLRHSILQLGRKCFILPVGHGKEKLFRWIDDIEIDYNSGLIKIKLAECLREYYLGLRERFTSYQLGYTVDFKSKYSYVLYDFIKSREYLGFFYYDVNEAKRDLAYDKYKSFTDFKRYVLDPAIKDINEKTDITVKYKAIKKGNQYTKLFFSILKKKGTKLAAVDKWKLKKNNTKENNQMIGELFPDEINAVLSEDVRSESMAEDEYKQAMKIAEEEMLTAI